MGAFIIAGLIFVGTIIVAGLMLFGAMMSDSPSASDDGGAALWTLGCGVVLAAVVAASHWMPHIGW